MNDYQLKALNIFSTATLGYCDPWGSLGRRGGSGRWPKRQPISTI